MSGVALQRSALALSAVVSDICRYICRFWRKIERNPIFHTLDKFIGHILPHFFARTLACYISGKNRTCANVYFIIEGVFQGNTISKPFMFLGRALHHFGDSSSNCHFSWTRYKKVSPIFSWNRTSAIIYFILWRQIRKVYHLHPHGTFVGNILHFLWGWKPGLPC